MSARSLVVAAAVMLAAVGGALITAVQRPGRGLTAAEASDPDGPAADIAALRAQLAALHRQLRMTQVTMPAAALAPVDDSGQRLPTKGIDEPDPELDEEHERRRRFAELTGFLAREHRDAEWESQVRTAVGRFVDSAEHEVALDELRCGTTLCELTFSADAPVARQLGDLLVRTALFSQGRFAYDRDGDRVKVRAFVARRNERLPSS